MAKECVEKFGDLKKPEAIVGTGPVDARQLPPQRRACTLVRNPSYFVAGLPYIDRVEVVVDEDNASRMAAFIAGKYDLGWEFPGTINRIDWVQIKDTLKQRRPKLQTIGLPGQRHEPPLLCAPTRPPFNDVRVRRAISMAIDRKGIIDAVAEGVGVHQPGGAGRAQGVVDPDRPARRGRPVLQVRPRGGQEAAGRGRAIPTASRPRSTSRPTAPRSSIDTCQLVLKNLKDVGIEAKLNRRSTAPTSRRTFYGKYESMAFGPQTPFLEPDNFLYGQYYPGELKNQSHVNDPVLADMLVRQRRTMDPAKRREIIYEIQRHLAKQQYYVQLPSGVYVGVWDGALKNYGPNLGYDYGGRLMAAWLDRVTDGKENRHGSVCLVTDPP